MDVKLNRVLKRQEQEYLKGYSIYVREKEKELRTLVEKLNERSNDETLKDEVIFGLKSQISKMYEQGMKAEEAQQKMKARIRSLTETNEYLEKDKQFMTD